MILRGVRQLVIDAMNRLVDYPSYPQRSWIEIRDDLISGISRREALYMVSKLEESFLEEDDQQQGGRNSTGLSFDHRCFLNAEAIQVICEFLQRASCMLTGLRLSSPSGRILRALHNNTSVKELTIAGFDEEDDDDASAGDLIRLLLENKTDFEGLHFCGHYRPIPLSDTILPFLRRGFPHLLELGLASCGLDNEQLESIRHALVDGNHHGRLKSLDFSFNGITPQGLAFFCSALRPSVFSQLQKLDLQCNANLLDDPAITQRFAQQFLLSPDTILKELFISRCDTLAVGGGYAIIIKSLESNNTLVSLDITDVDDGSQRQVIRDQLVESLPKIKRLENLATAVELLDENDQEFVTAYHQNTSLLKHSVHSEPPAQIFLNILNRNKYLALIHEMLGGGARLDLSTMATTVAAGAGGDRNTTNDHVPPSHSLWPLVLATVGQQGQEGGSPVFKILQAGLASWLAESTSNNGNKKRKHQETDQQQAAF